MFSDRLPENFPVPFEPAEHGGGKEAPAEKIAFLELLLRFPGQERRILELWTALFGERGDPWLERVKPVVTGRACSEPDKAEAAGTGLDTSECPEGGIAGTNSEAPVPPATSGTVGEP